MNRAHGVLSCQRIACVFAMTSACCFGQAAGIQTAAKITNAAAWPDPLILNTGKPISNSSEFLTTRRPEILREFEASVYGRTPQQPLPESMQLTSIEEHALGGAAVRKQITITIGSTALHRQLHLLLYL